MQFNPIVYSFYLLTSLILKITALNARICAYFGRTPILVRIMNTRYFEITLCTTMTAINYITNPHCPVCVSNIDYLQHATV